jgi:uncharacterized protein (TIGR03000 family)
MIRQLSFKVGVAALAAVALLLGGNEAQAQPGRGGGGGGRGGGFSGGARGGGFSGGGFRGGSFAGAARGYAAPARGYAAPAFGSATPARGFATPSRGFTTPSRGVTTPSRPYGYNSAYRTASNYARTGHSGHYRPYYASHHHNHHHRSNFFAFGLIYGGYGYWPYYGGYGGYGGYGDYGGYGGYGNYGGYGGDYGGYGYPDPGYGPPGYGEPPDLGPGAESRPPIDNAVHLQLNVPENAEVFIDGAKTSKTGRVREFVSPPVTPGQRYAYKILVRIPGPGGKAVNDERTIYVRANDWFSIDFTRPAPAEPPAMPPASPKAP